MWGRKEIEKANENGANRDTIQSGLNRTEDSKFLPDPFAVPVTGPVDDLDDEYEPITR